MLTRGLFDTAARIVMQPEAGPLLPVSVLPVRRQISRPVDSECGPFAGFAIEVGPTPGRLRSRSGDWPAATGRRGIPCREARRADLTGMKGRSTMVVKLIMRSC